MSPRGAGEPPPPPNPPGVLIAKRTIRDPVTGQPTYTRTYLTWRYPFLIRMRFRFREADE